jgi:hypothetical protein
MGRDDFVSLEKLDTEIRTLLKRIRAVSAGAGASTFLDLTDTPNSYSGQASKFLRVNTGETMLEFVAVSIPSSFLDLSDTPSSYSGQGNKVVKVKATEDGLEFSTEAGDMLKSVYDTDNDGRVDTSESVSDGIYTSTAAEVRQAVDGRPIYDNDFKCLTTTG